MKRKRINATAICSSANYAASKKAHRLMLQLNHEEHQELFVRVQSEVSVIEIKYTQVKIFGKWINLDGANPESFKGFELR